MTITTALLYARVSTDEQATHGLSLDAQLAECRRYAVRQEWSIDGEFVDALSGLKDARPQYQRLLATVRVMRAEGRAVAVVVAALDRFGRRLLERVERRAELKALGVPTHSVREGGEVSDLVANILAAVAEEETRRLGERVRATRAHLRATGWKPPGRPPLGYRWRPPTDAERAAGAPSSVLDEDPVTAETVREAFAQLSAGLSMRKVAAWLGGLPPESRGGRDLALSVVSGLLRAPVYVARPDEGAPDVLARPVARWPALLTDGQWLRVQMRIRSHRRFPHQITGRFLLIGYFRCPKCGHRITGHKTRWGLRYRCADLPHAEGACRWAIAVGTIDGPVLREVGALLAAVAEQKAPALAAAWDRLAKPARRSDRSQRIAALRREVVGAKDRLLRATHAYVDGAIDALSYELARDEAQETIAGAEREIARLGELTEQATLPEFRLVRATLASMGELLVSAEVPAQREVLAELIERVDVAYVPPDPGRHHGRYEVSVCWTPFAEALQAVAS